jgi:hypothetical protein
MSKIKIRIEKTDENHNILNQTEAKFSEETIHEMNYSYGYDKNSLTILQDVFKQMLLKFEKEINSK